MINLKKKNTTLSRILKDSRLTTKISIFMSTKSYGEDYDPYEAKATYTNLNPITILGYVRDIDTESLVWRQMGLQETGAKEILCDGKYINYFRKANKIVIDSDTYEVYKEGVGGRASIESVPIKLIKVIIRKT